MNTHPKTHYICRLSLSFLWLWTAVTSFWWGRAVGYEVLSSQGIEGALADACINAGSLLDVVIGIWLLSNLKMQWCYRVQIILIISYTILLTIIDASYWLHPFGPLTKNIPLLALLLVLLQPAFKPVDNPPQKC